MDSDYEPFYSDNSASHSTFAHSGSNRDVGFSQATQVSQPMLDSIFGDDSRHGATPSTTLREEALRENMDSPSGYSNQPVHHQDLGLAWLQKDPEGYRQYLLNQASQYVQQATQRQEAVQALLDRYTQNYPHLVDLKREVSYRAQAIYNAAHEAGVPMGEWDAVQQAVQFFQTRFENASAKTVQGMPPINTSSSNPMQKVAMRLDVHGTTQNRVPMSPEMIWNMSNDEFEAYCRQVKRHHYGY